MKNEYKEIKNRALSRIIDQMCVCARTAPKTKGQDNTIIKIVHRKEKRSLIEKMRQLADCDEKKKSLRRDACCIENCEHILIVGIKSSLMGLNCGFCGSPTCEELSEKGGVCAFNSIDLGIALGSAISLAARSHADNRLMYSIGKAALELGILGPETVQAVGIPLSATGKNPFFDRG